MSDERAGQKDPKIVKVICRGREIHVASDKNSPLSALTPLYLSLLALEDPRIDEIMKAFGVKITDVGGKVVFPS
jgi:hypothetical protein